MSSQNLNRGIGFSIIDESLGVIGSPMTLRPSQADLALTETIALLPDREFP